MFSNIAKPMLLGTCLLALYQYGNKQPSATCEINHVEEVRKNIDELSPEQRILIAFVLLLGVTFFANVFRSCRYPDIHPTKNNLHPELETWTICWGVCWGMGSFCRDLRDSTWKKGTSSSKVPFWGDMLVSGRVAFAQSQTSPYFQCFPFPK